MLELALASLFPFSAHKAPLNVVPATPFGDEHALKTDKSCAMITPPGKHMRVNPPPPFSVPATPGSRCCGQPAGDTRAGVPFPSLPPSAADLPADGDLVSGI